MDPADIKERAPRAEARITGHLRRANGRIQSALIENLSEQGCAVSGCFPIGEFVTLSLPKLGNLRAQVRWSFQARAGLRFLKE